MNLAPGTYRLTKDIPAPMPDKRERHDWRKAPVPAGTLFAIRDESYWAPGLLTVARLRGFSTHSLSVSDPRARALLEALEAVDETPSLWLLREQSDNSALDILDHLQRTGQITLDAVKSALHCIHPPRFVLPQTEGGPHGPAD